MPKKPDEPMPTESCYTCSGMKKFKEFQSLYGLLFNIINI